MSERFTERHPYWFVAIVEVAVIVVYLLAGTAAHFLGLTNVGLYTLANLALALVVAVVLTRMRWWGAVGFRAPEGAGDLWYYAMPFLPMLINLVPGIQVSSLGFLLQILVMTLAVGFVEEGVYRGLMLEAIRPLGAWRALFITSVLFGLTHSMNVLAGKSPLEDGLQVLYAMAIGFGFGALVLRKGLIWPLVLAHFLIDFAHFMQAPGFAFPVGWELAITAGLIVVFVGYGLFVMLSEPGHASVPARSSA